MVDVLIRYIASGIGRFIASVYIQFMIIATLNVTEYAHFGFVNSIIMLVGLLLTLNSETAFQRMYANRRIWGAVNGAFLVLYILSISIFSFIFLLVKNLIDLSSIHAGIYDVISIDGFILLSATLTLYNLSISLVNSLKITNIYVLLNFLPNFIIAIIISILGNFDLPQLLNIISGSYLIVLSTVVIIQYKSIINAPIDFKRLGFFLIYIISYTKHSFHTVGTKYILDLTLRSLLLERFGATVLASYNLSGAVLGIFRSIEQNVTKAITPTFLSLKLNRDRLLHGTKLIIAFQTVITGAIFSTSFFWYPLLGHYLPNKPVEIFYPDILVAVAIVTIIGYWKNYLIMILKQKWFTMKLLYLQTTVFNIASIILIYLLGFNIYVILAIWNICQLGNLFFLSRITKNL